MSSLPSRRSYNHLSLVLLGSAGAVLAGLAVTYANVGPMGFSRLLLVPLGALLLLPFCIAAFKKQKINLLEPIFIVVFGYGLFLFVRPLYILTFNDFEFMGFINAPKEAIPLAIALSILGLAVLYLGYYSSVGPTIARRLPAGGGVPPQRLRNSGLILLVLGSLLYLAFLTGPGGGAEGDAGFGSSAYFYLGVNVAAVGIFLLGNWIMLRPQWTKILLLLALLVAFIGVSTYTGKRYHLLYLGLSLAASFYLFRRKPFTFRSLLLFLPPAFLYITGVGFVRGGESVTLTAAAGYEPVAAAQRFFASADLGTFDTFTRILGVVPESFPFVMPGRTFLYLFVAFVPRSLWPDKPLPTSELVLQEVVGDVGAIGSGGGYTYSLLGGLYIEGGIMMLVVGTFIFGVFCRAVWHYYVLNGHLLSQAVLAVSLPHVLLLQRGFNDNTLVWYLTYLVPILIVFHYASGLKKERIGRRHL